MPKRRIIIKGNIQGAGYRVLVKKIAHSLGIKGVVRNLANGAVEIYCEGNAKSLKRFLEMIDIKRRDGNLLAIDVTKIRTYHERARGYRKTKAPERFTVFDVDYGGDLIFAEKEMIERQELMILGGSQMWSSIDVVGEKIDTGFTELGKKVDGVGRDVKEVGKKVDGVGRDVKEVGKKVDGVGRDVKEVGKKVDLMHDDMNERFDKLDEKYALIGESIIQTNKNLERMNENIANLVETTSENNAKMNENIKEMNQSIAKSNKNNARSIENNERLTNTLLKMVEDHFEKDHDR